MPGKARTSAIGGRPQQLDITQVGHARDLFESPQHLGGNPLVDGENHHRVAPRSIPSHLHARDVYVVLAQDAAHPADHPGTVLVTADQEAAFRHEVDAKRVDAHRPSLSYQDGARDLVVEHPDRDQARVAAVRTAPPFDETNAAVGGDQSRIDRVDALFGERLDDALDG